MSDPVSTDSFQPPKKRRSKGQVRSAAKMLEAEARRILKKFASRLSPDAIESIRASLAAINTHRTTKDWHALEDEAEHLDELLQKQAAFARKSTLRETIENVGFAILVALSVRSCLYEPFKIPSSSMMPTLRTGDHIFVNKFSHGVQIPLTSTIVAEDLISPIRRGEVIVFRYPLDTSEDFIKRVIGLPGDTIQIKGEEIQIKPKGSQAFETVQRRALDIPCLEEHDHEATVPGCTVYEEELDGHQYHVQYVQGFGHVFSARERTIEIPDDQFLVMGDNRRRSADSLQWVEIDEALSAKGLLSVQDLRDLGEDDQYRTIARRDADIAVGDATIDQVKYVAIHRSAKHLLHLDVWRKPSWGSKTVFSALQKGLPDSRPTTVESLIQGARYLRGPALDKAAAIGQEIDDLIIGAQQEQVEAIFRLAPLDTVFRLRCGVEACDSDEALATRITKIVGRLLRNQTSDADDLMDGDPQIQYDLHSHSRHSNLKNRYYETEFIGNVKGATQEASRIRFRAWKGLDEGVELIRQIALEHLQVTRSDMQALVDIGDDAWIVDQKHQYAAMVINSKLDLAFFVECGRQRCSTRELIQELTKRISERTLKMQDDRQITLANLLVSEDVGAWEQVEKPIDSNYYWDDVRLEASLANSDFSITIKASYKPEEGLAAQLAAWRNEMPNAVPDSTVAQGGLSSSDGNRIQLLFAIEASDLVVAIDCGLGLCSNLEATAKIAKRIAQNARDKSRFIDPNAEIWRPFVPRGHIKGRADLIWLPTHRSGTVIE